MRTDDAVLPNIWPVNDSQRQTMSKKAKKGKFLLPAIILYNIFIDLLCFCVSALRVLNLMQA